MDKTAVIVDNPEGNLKKRRKYARVVQICQNEPTNHIRVTVQELTVFVLVLQRRLVAPY